MLGRLKPIADSHNVTLSQLVINWTTRQPAMDCVLVGGRNEKQVKENAAALQFRLSEEELATIQEIVNDFKLVEA